MSLKWQFKMVLCEHFASQNQQMQSDSVSGVNPHDMNNLQLNQTTGPSGSGLSVQTGSGSGFILPHMSPT